MSLEMKAWIVIAICMAVMAIMIASLIVMFRRPTRPPMDRDVQDVLTDVLDGVAHAADVGGVLAILDRVAAGKAGEQLAGQLAGYADNVVAAGLMHRLTSTEKALEVAQATYAQCLQYGGDRAAALKTTEDLQRQLLALAALAGATPLRSAS